MSYDKIKPAIDYLGAGRVAGDSLQQVHNKLKPLGNLPEGLLQQATLDCIALGNSESHIAHFIAPSNIQIVGIYGVKQASGGAAATATLVVRASDNPLDGTNIDMDALSTANTPESQTLSSTESKLQMAAGDCLKCTFACDGASTLTGAAVGIVYKYIE